MKVMTAVRTGIWSLALFLAGMTFLFPTRAKANAVLTVEIIGTPASSVTLDAYSFGTGDLSASFALNPSTDPFFADLPGGRHISSAVITDTNLKKKTELVITLTDDTVTSVSVSGRDTVFATVTFSYEALDIQETKLHGSTTPEPASLLLLSTGLISFAPFFRRRLVS